MLFSSLLFFFPVFESSAIERSAVDSIKVICENLFGVGEEHFFFFLCFENGNEANVYSG